MVALLLLGDGIGDRRVRLLDRLPRPLDEREDDRDDDEQCDHAPAEDAEEVVSQDESA